MPNENVLVGFDTSDDAGVYKLSESLALVHGRRPEVQVFNEDRSAGCYGRVVRLAADDEA